MMTGGRRSELSGAAEEHPSFSWPLKPDGVPKEIDLSNEQTSFELRDASQESG